MYRVVRNIIHSTNASNPSIQEHSVSDLSHGQLNGPDALGIHLERFAESTRNLSPGAIRRRHGSNGLLALYSRGIELRRVVVDLHFR
jgi:hypothetical protein